MGTSGKSKLIESEYWKAVKIDRFSMFGVKWNPLFKKNGEIVLNLGSLELIDWVRGAPSNVVDSISMSDLCANSVL